MKLFQPKISRRMLVAGAAAAAIPAGAGSRAATKARPRALALIGDRYHNPDYIRVSLDKVLLDIRARDLRDSTRGTAPMQPADDAALLDTSFLSIDAAIQRAITLVEARTAAKVATP